MNIGIDINHIVEQFQSETFNSEDDIKLKTYADIILPIKNQFAPNANFNSEHVFVAGGRADGTIGNLVIEYKKKNYFQTKYGCDEALYGRKQDKNDSGLYEYIIDSIKGNDINDTILDTFGIGFDGETWLVARFIKTNEAQPLNITRTRFAQKYHSQTQSAPYQFSFKKFSLVEGILQLITLFSSTEKIKLSKENLTQVINPKTPQTAQAIMQLYQIICRQLNIKEPQRTTTLYHEWDQTFGTMFGDESQETEFNQTTDAIKALYNIPTTTKLAFKPFLFATQTYFNILLKIMIDRFIKRITDPTGDTGFHLLWSDLVELFEGRENNSAAIVDNFFEIHYYEWFTYLRCENDEQAIMKIVNDIIDTFQKFDLATFQVRPEEVQDILQEIYMTLIPDKVRHLMGEYFSPDWIVEHALDRVGYTGDINKKIIDPTCGSGSFVIHAIKRILANKNNQITINDAQQIVNNVVGFDLNPISAVSAKANYIITLFSSLSEPITELQAPLSIPIYISDSVLSPIVYSENGVDTFIAKTTVANFTLPKFNSFSESNFFLNELSKSVERSRGFSTFDILVLKSLKLSKHQYDAVKETYEKMCSLHRSAQDSFWGRILKNSFAPTMLKQKFDYVVGNPPWIAWKSMSKRYRQGTLDVWKSYGIFEKNAYDKKTTHDDFGMAVTYVALDQYLKENGKLYFLLPWTFLKSTKGGEGFRKFVITRNHQQIPVKVALVDDFNDIKIFKPKHTVRTIGVLFVKGQATIYPMKQWFEWHYRQQKLNFAAHLTWYDVQKNLTNVQLVARPIDSSNLQSAWLTLKACELQLTDAVLLNGAKPAYHARKGIEPAGAKGVYILKKPVLVNNNHLKIINDMSRQRRADIKNKGAHQGIIENNYVFPMLGGRNIKRWQVVSNEFMLVPHDATTPYGLSETTLASQAPLTYEWLEYYRPELLATRIQNGKFFNPDTQPWYRLDNVGKYTFSKYKVLWKEQSASFAAVAVGTYSSLPNADLSLFNGEDKTVVTDSKVLSLAVNSMNEAYFVTGVLNAPSIRRIIDAYAVGLNRGTNVLANIKVPKFDANNHLHQQIANISSIIHQFARTNQSQIIAVKEQELNNLVVQLFSNEK